MVLILKFILGKWSLYARDITLYKRKESRADKNRTPFVLIFCGQHSLDGKESEYEVIGEMRSPRHKKFGEFKKFIQTYLIGQEGDQFSFISTGKRMEIYQ